MIRIVKKEDAGAICKIYNHFIEKTIVTFEDLPVTIAEMADRIHHVTKEYPWFVYEEAGQVIGYCYAKRYKERHAYRYAVESTVYLAPCAQGRGIGTALYQKLLDTLREHKIHSVVAIIALPNPASVRLHEKLGFKQVAHLKEMGWKFDQWIDVGYWQLVVGDGE